MWDKIKSALKWIGAALLTIVGILLGKKLYDMLKPKPTEVNGSIVNPNKKEDLKEADRIKADRESLEKDI
jgi:hypothetical protein